MSKVCVFNPRKRTQTESLRASWWPECLAAGVAIAGLMIGILGHFHPALGQQSGSDFKTLYAAAYCLQHHLDPYSSIQIAAVFQREGVVLPASWYGHASVYPPFTLALLEPFTALPMLPAIGLWLALSWGLLTAACFALARAAGERFNLSRPWRLGVIALFAASPLLSFGLEMGNVSPIAAALCLLAVLSVRRDVLAAAALALALLLKPHLAIWIAVALIVSRSTRDRRVALRALAAAVVAVIAISLWMAASHRLLPDLAAYHGIVQAESASGSMAPAARDVLAVAAQITSLDSLLGYWFASSLVSSLLSFVVLGGLFAALWVLSRSPGAESPAARLNLIAAWSAFGLLATYHRAHDGLTLTLLLPYLLSRLRERWRDPFVWSLLTAGFLMGFGLTPEALVRMIHTGTPFAAVAEFTLYRQSAAASLILLVLLIGGEARLRTRRTAAMREHPSVAMMA